MPERLMHARCIPVRTPNEQYDIYVGAGLLPQVGEHVAALSPGRRAFIVSHPSLYALYGHPLAASLAEQGFAVEACLVPEGERSKTLSMASRLYTRLARAGADRHSVLCALGGGVIGDLGGFVAATYMRGIPLVHLPTSLLAMVDSSIGGKTAVNHRLGKNLIGAFYPPRAVFTDVTLLASLPPREYRSGLSEVVKAGVIADAELFAFLEAHAAEVRQRQEAALRFCIERAVAVKVNVVQQDPTERGVRAILNFGHTIGHALEAATAYTRYTHGEAVAIGMALVAHLSVELGYCRSETRDRLLRLLQALELPVTGIEVAPSRLLELMSRDKKALHGIVRFVLLKDIGAVCYHQEVPAAVLHALLQQHASPSGG